MAKNNNSAEAKIEQKPDKKTEQKFPVATLRDNCVKLFGCTSSTFDGAFFGREETALSIEAANNVIKGWLRKEIGK